MAVTVIVRGQQGPAGPASVAVGSVITARGRLAVGNSVGTPVALAPGASGTYLRSNGTDPLYSAILAADLPAAIDAAKINTGVVSNAEFNFLDGVTSAIQTQFAGKAALVHAHTDRAERGIYIAHDSQSTATPSDNTTSTVTYAIAMDTTLTLPTGTYTVRAMGGLSAIHSAAGTMLYRVSVDGQDSTARSMTVSATNYNWGMDEDSKAGLSGTVHVYVHFRSSTAGTTTVRGPFLWVTAERTP